MRNADAREATLEAGYVVTNLPFGIRVSDDLRTLYEAFATRLRDGRLDASVVVCSNLS